MKKLKKILLINWLYFSKEIIEVGDINFLTGKNGAGKSTVIDALQIVLLGETNARNFNQAANEKSQRTLDGYLRADMDENNPYSRRGKDFSSYIACEFQDDVVGSSFVTGVVFDCRSDGSRQERFFIYVGTLPENCFVENGEAMEIPALRRFLKQNYTKAEIYDTQKEYRRNMLSRWNVHNEQVLRMMKKAVSFRPIVDIQKFITENICDIPEKPDIEAMQQNIRDYKRHEMLVQRQEEKLTALQEISKLYREMNQAIDRWRVQSFLVLWSKKEMEQAQIDRFELEKRDSTTELAAIEKSIMTISDRITQKENRRRELDLACAQSSVFQEEEKLRNRKQALLDEQKRLTQDLQSLAMEIKRESLQLNGLCDAILKQDAEGVLVPVQEAAESVLKAYSLFTSGSYEIFSYSSAPFEIAQQAAAELAKTIRDALHKAEDRLAELKEEQDQKRTVLANLRKDIKDYPRGLLQLKARLESELNSRIGSPVRIDILADVLELADERWRGAVEGYLNAQKFYLLVDPAYYKSALLIFDRIKKEFGFASFGLVDIGKLREREMIRPRDDSLARKVDTDNKLARSYIDYLLGRVVCCEKAEQLRNFKTAITTDGLLYQGYVVRSIQRKLMDDAFIGRRAINLRVSRLEEELTQIEDQLRYWNPIRQLLSQSKEPLFTHFFVQNTVAEKQKAYLRGMEIVNEVTDIEDQLSKLDLLWLDEQRRTIAALGDEIIALNKEKEQKGIQIGQHKERIRQLDYEVLPDHYQQLTYMEDRLQDEFPSKYQESIGLPRYQQELARLKRADIVHKNFSSRLEQSVKEQDTARKKLFIARREYTDRFKPCSFRVEAMDNDEFESERRLLEESELPKYREKINAARESAMEQFQNDFLAKLKSSIDQVQDQVKNLNRALRQAQFGTDSYQFRVERNPDYAEYYDMIMDPELMEGDVGLFARPFQDKYGQLIEKLFSQITTADDTQLNARKQSELQENIQRYTDFRTYLKFDLETTDQNRTKQLLSQTLNTKSGGETQTPFYIAVLASFAQLYRVNDTSSFGNTVRLAVFDEAFNKMDSDRIIESVRLLRRMGLQAIICTPPDKVSDIMPIADRTLLVNKDKYRMHILPFGKEIAQ